MPEDTETDNEILLNLQKIREVVYHIVLSLANGINDCLALQSSKNINMRPHALSSALPANKNHPNDAPQILGQITSLETILNRLRSYKTTTCQNLKVHKMMGGWEAT